MNAKPVLALLIVNACAFSRSDARGLVIDFDRANLRYPKPQGGHLRRSVGSLFSKAALQSGERPGRSLHGAVPKNWLLSRQCVLQLSCTVSHTLDPCSIVYTQEKIAHGLRYGFPIPGGKQ
jgi:hypothetical protein